jgi:hypothetical protein
MAPLTITPASAQEKKPNILFIMGDDIGWIQVGVYHRGIGIGETPNIDLSFPKIISGRNGGAVQPGSGWR